MFIFVATMATFFFIGDLKLNEHFRLEKETNARINIALQNIPVEAKAVSIYNITQNKKIYGKNDEVVLPLASLAKIMTIIVALHSHEPNEIISLSPEAINQAGDFGLLVNEKWNIYNLAQLTLINSANDGAYALSENNLQNFLEKMNGKAQRIGMEHTSFLNFTGLDLDLENAGSFASAVDVNIMALYAYQAYPEIFLTTILPEINLKSESGFTHNFKNTNTIIDKIPNLLFSKTGFTEVAGGNLVIIFKDKKGEEIAVTVLGSTFKGRFSDMEKIVDVLYNF
ncbi:MAG: hypothetical protein AAB786_02580 [Patescibacteria group bacterium]|mgnify:FL=1